VNATATPDLLGGDGEACLMVDGSPMLTQDAAEYFLKPFLFPELGSPWKLVATTRSIKSNLSRLLKKVRCTKRRAGPCGPAQRFAQRLA